MRNYDSLKSLYKKIFWIGTGNFWYEENEIGDDTTLPYKIRHYALIISLFTMVILQMMVIFIGDDFPEQEKNDAVSIGISTMMVLFKIYSIETNKPLIRKLNKSIVNICEKYEDQKLMQRQHNIIKINSFAYFFFVYGSLLCFIFEGLRRQFSGSHFVTVVTYYPAYEDNSIPATITRISTTLIWSYMMIWMILSIDIHAMIHLIIYKYKFVTLRQYFENLGNEFQKLIEAGEKDLAHETFANGLVEGIQMHNSLIRLLDDIHKSFGTVISVQVCLSLSSAVPLLVQFALATDLNLVGKVKVILFLVALYYCLGVYLCNAGAITYEASCVADAIFYSSWYLCSPRVRTMPGRNIRHLVLLAIMQAQRPLVMKSFKMLDLTYGSYLSVVRGSYSVYALIVSSQDK